MMGSKINWIGQALAGRVKLFVYFGEKWLQLERYHWGYADFTSNNGVVGWDRTALLDYPLRVTDREGHTYIM